MSYRYNHEPPNPEDMLPRYAIRNGATLKIAFGCYYLALHDRYKHDYVGWPSPMHPDHICQVGVNEFRVHHRCTRFTMFGKEIDLINEGYESITISFEDPSVASGLTVVESEIDQKAPYVIRLKIRANFDTFTDDPKETRFTVFANNPWENQIDAICHGFITVLPGSPYPS